MKFIVTIEGCTEEEAEIVMAERLGYDEDYGFNYTISCHTLDREKAEQ